MIKIISLFQRNYEGDRRVRNEVVPGAEWVLAREGLPTEKLDGTSCLLSADGYFKRYDAKHGKTPPASFRAAQDEPDPVTGHWPGWIPVGDGPEDRWHREGLANSTHDGRSLGHGTYELVGPKVQGNPYKFLVHSLLKHGSGEVPGDPRTFEEVRSFLADNAIEGIVWHHDDGRMVKIKARDFGLSWPR